MKKYRKLTKTQAERLAHIKCAYKAHLDGKITKDKEEELARIALQDARILIEQYLGWAIEIETDNLLKEQGLEAILFQEISSLDTHSEVARMLFAKLLRLDLWGERLITASRALANELEGLNHGNTSILLSPSPDKLVDKKFKAKHDKLAKLKLRALEHIAFACGKGMSAAEAEEYVAKHYRKTRDTIRKWRAMPNLMVMGSEDLIASAYAYALIVESPNYTSGDISDHAAYIIEHVNAKLSEEALKKDGDLHYKLEAVSSK